MGLREVPYMSRTDTRNFGTSLPHFIYHTSVEALSIFVISLGSPQDVFQLLLYWILADNCSAVHVKKLTHVQF